MNTGVPEKELENTEKRQSEFLCTRCVHGF